MQMPSYHSGQQNGSMRCGEVRDNILLGYVMLILSAANGESFHFSFLNFFCLYSSLFLNSFGVQADAAPASSLLNILSLPSCDDILGKPDE